MKRRVLFGLISMAFLVSLSVPTVVAQQDKGSPVPEVGYRTIDANCGVSGGDYGFFTADDWWWAVYSNGIGVLKCETELPAGETPPAETITIPGETTCGTPAGSTADNFTRITPEGRVTLICIVR